MAELTDPRRLAAYRTALGFWRYDCYVHFRRRAYEWVRAELESISLREIGRVMHEHVAGGGLIDEIRETREPWVQEFEFHHDLRLALPTGRKLYIETVLELGHTAEDARITVVNIHDQ